MASPQGQQADKSKLSKDMIEAISDLPPGPCLLSSEEKAVSYQFLAVIYKYC